MAKKHSIFKELFDKRKSLAVKIGLTGIIFLLISILAKQIIMPHSSISATWRRKIKK